MMRFIEIFGVSYPSFSLVLWVYFWFALLMISRQCFVKYDIRFRNVCVCVLAAVPFTAIGGKLLFALTSGHNGDIFGGTVFYGGLFGFCAGVYVYTKITGRSFMKYMNFWVPYIAMAQAFGRIGCLLNGCCYGKESRLPVAIRYPEDHATYGTPVLPVPAMESLVCLMLTLFLFRRRQGNVSNFLVYMPAYAVIRFILEFARGDEIRGVYGIFSPSQWISLAIIIVAIPAIVLCKKEGEILSKKNWSTCYAIPFRDKHEAFIIKNPAKTLDDKKSKEQITSTKSQRLR